MPPTRPGAAATPHGQRQNQPSACFPARANAITLSSMKQHQADIAALRRAALGYPEAAEDHPWGEAAFKVRGKIFLMLTEGTETTAITLKLPTSRYFALDYPGTSPTGYGLGKAGWVTARFAPTERLPMPMILAWLDESYRAVAPKKRVSQLPPP